MNEYPIVDAHVHILPARRQSGLMRWIHRAFPEHPVPGDIDKYGILEDLERNRTKYFFNLVYPLNKFETDNLNLFNYQISKEYSNSACWGSLHPDNESKEGIIDKCISDYGFIGMKFHPFIQDFDVLDDGMKIVFEKMNEHRRPVFIHTGFDDFYNRRFDPGSIDVLMERYPDLSIILSHMFFPRIGECFMLMEKHKGLIGDLTNVPGALRMISEERGVPVSDMEITTLIKEKSEQFSERLIYGSDHPAGMGGYKTIFRDFDNIGFSSQVSRKIRYDNPIRIVNSYSNERWLI